VAEGIGGTWRDLAPRGPVLLAHLGVAQAGRCGRPGGLGPQVQEATLGRGGGARAAPPPERASVAGAGQDADRVGDHGKSARALGAALRERGTPRTGRSRDGRTPPRSRGSDLDEEGMRAAGREPLDDPASPPTAGAGPAATSSGAAEQVDRARASARVVGPAIRAVLRSGTGAGVGPAAR
jgi:hypothetical protein